MVAVRLEASEPVVCAEHYCDSVNAAEFVLCSEVLVSSLTGSSPDRHQCCGACCFGQIASVLQGELVWVVLTDGLQCGVGIEGLA